MLAVFPQSKKTKSFRTYGFVESHLGTIHRQGPQQHMSCDRRSRPDRSPSTHALHILHSLGSEIYFPLLLIMHSDTMLALYFLDLPEHTPIEFFRPHQRDEDSGWEWNNEASHTTK